MNRISIPSSARWIACVFGLCVFAGCGSSNEPSSREGREGTDPARLVVTGSSTIAPLISDVARRYEQEHPGVRIDVQTGGSSRGLTDARRGLADVGMVSRSPREGEDDVAWIPIALDGLAIIVHADSPVNVLSEEQVVAIYRGEIETWRDVGGEDAPITVVTKADGRSTLEVFLDHFGLTAQEIRADVVIGDNQQAIKTVVGNPDAIAYVSIGTAEYEAMQGAPLRLLRLGDFEPSTDAVRAGSYPVARTLHVVAKGESAPVVSEFLDFLLSPAVHDLVESHFFVPLDGPTPDGPAG